MNDTEIAKFLSGQCSRRMTPADKSLCDIVASGMLLNDYAEAWFNDLKETFASDIAYENGELGGSNCRETPDEEGASFL